LNSLGKYDKVQFLSLNKRLLKVSVVKKVIKSMLKTLFNVSRPTFTFENNELRFKIHSDKFFTYPLENYETKTRHDSYIIDAYTILQKDIFIEYIHTDEDVVWNGLAHKLFLDLLRVKLKVKSYEIYEEKEFDNYTFMTIKYDNYILNLVHIYEVNKEIFILDKNSSFYEQLYKNFDESYEYIYEKTDNRNLNLNVSLVKENAFFDYFSLESSV